ncbi:hypothetical protein ATO12_00360 [Aquimarina atlantica]|uniref:Uncharacterized protein n=1 Tax=Aquimarina atlantica TaxID=1317122 RepID=A0A023BYU7_9FLAO|nr:hypothetical protein [Aquimarina atlantica]EZH75262.1 hypothetical protein ATO12_00360 [Aquimarina atlantica]
MIINIDKSKKGIIRLKYDVKVNGKLKYHSKSNILLPYNKTDIYDLNKNRVLKVLDERTNSKFLNFNLTFKASNYQFKSDSFLEHNLFYQSKKISFFPQKGHLISIFLNNQQIGYFDKNKKTRFKGNKFIIEIIDNIIPEEILIGCVLAYDLKFYSNRDIILIYDPGFTSIKPLKKHNANWKENIKNV